LQLVRTLAIAFAPKETLDHVALMVPLDLLARLASLAPTVQTVTLEPKVHQVLQVPPVLLVNQA
jgi:hypothetical protein